MKSNLSRVAKIINLKNVGRLIAKTFINERAAIFNVVAFFVHIFFRLNSSGAASQKHTFEPFPPFDALFPL